jgi:hypothetical protein
MEIFRRGKKYVEFSTEFLDLLKISETPVSEMSSCSKNNLKTKDKNTRVSDDPICKVHQFLIRRFKKGINSKYLNMCVKKINNTSILHSRSWCSKTQTVVPSAQIFKDGIKVESYIF